MSNKELRVLIVAEHASARFGGEAALPLHYFRLLRKRNVETWMIVHERTRDELAAIFPDDFHRINFVPDTFYHRAVWQLSKLLPQRLSYFTGEFILRCMTQLMQRRIVQQLVCRHGITVIHQPIPVSPKEPSMIFGMKASVVIGPMNGGMDYPPAFQHMQSPLVDTAVKIGRQVTDLLNFLIPGKRYASALLVANSRTRRVLPQGVCSNIIELQENGVDLSVWKPIRQLAYISQPDKLSDNSLRQQGEQPIKFVYVGRLVNWKAVDLLLMAFKQVMEQVPATLEIIGEGPERSKLEAQARDLGLIDDRHREAFQDKNLQTTVLQTKPQEKVRFVGWLSQVDCASRLQQADVMVLPSLLECGGAAVLEAMTMGLPVIATKWGGLSDYLDDSCGILVEPTSQEAFIAGLAAAMVRMATSPELRQTMGQAGRRRALKHFDWEAKIDRVLEIYHQVLDSTPEPQRQILKQNGVAIKSART